VPRHRLPAEEESGHHYEPTKEGMKPYIIEECVDEAEVKSLMIAFMDVKLGQVLTTVANMI
jgi:hypothetical protein